MTELQLRDAGRRLLTECKLGTHVSDAKQLKGVSENVRNGRLAQGGALRLGTPANPPRFPSPSCNIQGTAEFSSD